MPHRSLDELRLNLRNFAAERQWEQFHNPKDLAVALSVEAGELLEHFLWIDPKESNRLPAERMANVKREVADVLIYLVRLSDVLGIDLLDAADDKLQENDRKYPADRVRGKALKYTEYDK